MSKQVTVLCDLCNAEVSSLSTERDCALIKLWSPGAYRSGPGQRIDLCVKCYNKFVNFLEKEGKTNDTRD